MSKILKYTLWLALTCFTTTTQAGFLSTCASIRDRVFGLVAPAFETVQTKNGNELYTPLAERAEVYERLRKMSTQEIIAILRNNFLYKKKDYLQYNAVAERIFAEFSELFPNATNEKYGLLFDFGILENWPEFKTFIERNSNDIRSKQPMEMREAFSRELGTETIYRGVALPKSNFKSSEEALTFLKTKGNWGVDPRGKSLKQKNQLISKIFLGGEQASFRTMQTGRYAWNNYLDTMVSASKFPEISRNVAVHTSSGLSENFIFLLTLEVPKINIIRNKTGGLFSSRQFDRTSTTPIMQYYVEGKHVRDSVSEDQVEVFLPFHMRPSWIVDSKQITRYPYPEYESKAVMPYRGY